MDITQQLSMGNQLMKPLSRCIALLLAAVSITLSQARYSDEIKPYVEFLQTQRVPAKDYILSLFEKHDIVILCERIHTEFTQYELFASIVEDKRFIDSVGNIFTEIGSVSQSSDVAHFLHTENMSPDSANTAILNFQRNCSFWPLWTNKNLSFFIQRLYDLNKKLPTRNKLNLYPSDVPFTWRDMDTTWLKTFWGRTEALRDSIMAQRIITTFDSISQNFTTRKKALVIMNYRHAFGHRWEYPVGIKPANVGRFLFDRYGERVANVYVNGLAITESGNLAIIQEGKWDASFEALKIEDVGFDFVTSPFGSDDFDIWPYKPRNFKYKDVFNGFAFYLPLKKHRIAYGVPGLVDSVFAHEVMRRYQMYQAVPNVEQGYVPTDWRSILRDFSVEDEHSLPRLDSLSIKTLKWLR
jgi:hypothetical protein